MRRSNRGAWRTVAVCLSAAMVAGACAAAATPLPSTQTAPPTPAITPDPHLVAPASVDDVVRLLASSGLKITPNTASSEPDGEPVKRINATYASWPLVLTQFTTAAALRKIAAFDLAKGPRAGEAPFNLAGLNILVEFGPRVTNTGRPEAPPATKKEAFEALVAALDRLLGPLTQRSVEPVPLPVWTPAPGSSPSRAPASPSAAPAPARSAKP